MTRDFIFDASGAVIGYRCRVEVVLNGDGRQWDKGYCHRLFPTARGLRLHQRLAHGLFKQLSFAEVEALEKRNEL